MLSRRSLLASVSAAAAVAVLPGCRGSGSGVVDVRQFGARGDGVTDDSQAIQAAVAALRSKGTLLFPSGVYRFAQLHPSGASAICITGVSDVDVHFDPDAELLMDNLDPATRTGTSHGVLVQGPASRISLQNLKIRWAAGSQRSLGDGIRVVGCPAFGAATPTGWSGPPTPVDGITLSDCAVRGSPQAGVIMLGVSGITVTRLQVAGSGADGLHFNACRRARIDHYSAADTGDDGLALVTYHTPRYSFDSAAQTFSLPSWTDWSNADFAINDVSVSRSRANGVRVAGADRVTVRGLRVDGTSSGSAVMVDSAEPGTDVGWHYVASRAVRIDEVEVTDCDTGIHLLARPGGSGDRRFTDFDVRIDDAKLDSCSNWSVHVESLTDDQVGGLRMTNCSVSSSSTAGGNGGVGVRNAAGISFGEVSIRHAEPVVAFNAVHAANLAVNSLSVSITEPAQLTAAPPPCVSFEDSDGVINTMELRWPAAPSSWNALRLSTTGRCFGDLQQAPVAIRNLKLIPPVSNSMVVCP